MTPASATGGSTPRSSLPSSPAIPMLAERLVANLVDNAVRYNDADGDIWISTRATADGSRLTVANTGPLISRGGCQPHLPALRAAQRPHVA